MVALNLCRALRQLRPNQSVALLITDRKLVSERMVMPEGVQLVVFDDHLGDDLSYVRKQALLRDLLLAARPECFHNINSEVAWHLILAEGERLKRFTLLFASIFAFQFAPDGRQKIGYAAYFLKQGMPHLAGLLSDNQRFIDDAAREYMLSSEERARMAVLYQPCRLLLGAGRELSRQRLAQRRERLAEVLSRGGRPQILWAGRLDAEKRVDLFLDVVRRCTFADFRVFGQVVLEEGAVLPNLPNLSYEGPFSSPMEWLERFDFDAFVFTSRWEGMPNILVEVGALGIPVIAPAVGGVGELVSVETGYPLPERPSVDDYEQALRAVSESPQQAIARADRMLERVLARHNWDSFVEAVERVPGYVGQQLADAQAAPTPGGNLEEVGPLVSVVIPCYNQARYLPQSIASVLAACSHSLEIIVVDDGSTDQKTTHYLSEAEQMAPGVVRIHRQANQGLSGARNSGIAMARGQFIQLLDADDLLTPDKIDAQVAQLRVNPSLDVSICNFLLCDESRTDFTKPGEAIAQFDLSEQDFLYRWERGFAIPIHCGVFRRRIFEGVRFDTHARAKEDWLFWTTLSLAGVSFGYIHGHWAIYRQHEGSMRRSYVNMGRSWLQAGLKIDGMLAGREPLFFESVVSWFEQCYRSNSAYQQEVASLQTKVAGESGQTLASAALSPVSGYSQMVNAEDLISRLERREWTGVKPFISVVIPVYNHYEYLEQCIGSIAEQEDIQLEVVCVDDASPDQQVTELMRALQDRFPYLKIIIHSVNLGISRSQNDAVTAATGEFVAFLDCDDVLAPKALSVVADRIQRHPDVDYFFTDRFDVNESGQVVRVARYGGYAALTFRDQIHIRDDLLDGMVASHLKVIRRSAYLAVGGCDDAFSGVQDWSLALKIAECGKLHYIDQPLYYHRVHSASVTQSESVTQFYKSNVLRRYFIERWLRQSRFIAAGAPMRMYEQTEFPIELEILKQAWHEGAYCSLRIRGPIKASLCNFLREFNSYFDEIHWNDPTVPAALMGYLWSNSILRYQE
ncbi:MAG: LmbE family protein [Nitrosomonas europaea]|nr:MAG: LmbE family protein [Nitrosomonas europaea]